MTPTILLLLFVLLCAVVIRQLPSTTKLVGEWKRIADTYNFEYVKSGFVSEIKNTWISKHMGYIGGDPFDVLRGFYKGVAVALYHFDVNDGKYNASYTVIEIDLEKEMPHFLVTHPGAVGILDSTNAEWLTMGKDFNNQVSMYVENHFEQEAYEILTPEFQAWLIANIQDFNFELYGKTHYTYLTKTSYSLPEIGLLLDKAIAVGEFLKPKLEEMEGDVKAMEEAVATPQRIL